MDEIDMILENSIYTFEEYCAILERIEKRGSYWVVLSKDKRKKRIFGKHKTKTKAMKQIARIEMETKRQQKK